MAVAYVGESNGATGTGTVTPSVSSISGLKVGHLVILHCETANQSVTAPAGWQKKYEFGTGTAGGTTATRNTILWRRWQAGDANPTIADPGDHLLVNAIAFSGVKATGDPFAAGAAADNNSGTGTAVTIPGVTTTVNGSMVVQMWAAARDGDNAPTVGSGGLTNASLSGFALLGNDFTTDGNGGNIRSYSGIDTTAGAVSSIAFTLNNSDTWATLAFTLLPQDMTTFPFNLVANDNGEIFDASNANALASTNDGSSTGAAVNGTVGAWLGEVNGHQFTQATAGNRPTRLSDGSLKSDGLDWMQADMALLPTTGDFTLVVAAQLDETEQGDLILQWASAQAGRFIFITNGEHTSTAGTQDESRKGRATPFLQGSTNGSSVASGYPADVDPGVGRPFVFTMRIQSGTDASNIRLNGREVDTFTRPTNLYVGDVTKIFGHASRANDSECRMFWMAVVWDYLDDTDTANLEAVAMTKSAASIDPPLAPATPIPGALGSITMRPSTGEILSARGHYNPTEHQSLAKIMNAVVATQWITNWAATQTITAGDLSRTSGGTQAGLAAGDVITLEELLYCMMLPSGCEAAEAMARYVGNLMLIADGAPSAVETTQVARFLSAMNALGTSIGFRMTVYNTVSGFTGTNDSIALDHALLVSYIIKRSPTYAKLLTVWGTPTHSAAIVRGGSPSSLSLTNSHDMVENGDADVIGGKTGSNGTTNIFNAMTLWRDAGGTFVTVNLGSKTDGQRFTDARAIIDDANAYTAGTEDLTPTAVTTSPPTVGAPALGQVHALTASPLTVSAPVAGSPALVQIVALTTTGLTVGSPTFGTATLLQVHNLGASALTTGPPECGVGPNLFSNGDFSNGLTDWFVTSGGSITSSGGVAIWTGAAANRLISQDMSLTVGKIYRLGYDVTAYSTGRLAPSLHDGTVVGTGGNVVGPNSNDFVYASGVAYGVRSVGATGTNASIDNVYLRELQAALGQVHVLSFAGLTVDAAVVGAPALTQVHALVATGLAVGAPVLGTPALGNTIVDLVADDLVVGAPVVGAPALVEIVALTSTGLTTSAAVVGAPALAQVHALTATGIAVGSPAIGAPALGVIVALIASDLTVSSPEYGFGRQLIVNGGFDGQSPWTHSGFISFTGGQAVFDATPSGRVVQQLPTVTVGKFYELIWTMTERSAGALANANINGVLGTQQTVPGTYSYKFIYASGTAVAIRSAGTTTAKLDDVSLREWQAILGQIHVLTTTNISITAPVVGSPSLKQIHALIASGITTSPAVVGSPAVGQKHALTANGIDTSAPVVGAPALGQVHNLSTELGSEIIVNGDFDSNVTGWSASAQATLAWNAGRLSVASATGAGYGQQTLTGLTVGQLYELRVLFISVSGGANKYILVGTAPGGGQLVSLQNAAVAVGWNKAQFRATQTTHYLSVGTFTGQTALFDSISVRRVIGLETGAPVVGGPALGQVHALTANGIATGSPVIGTPSMAQVNVLVAVGITTSPAEVGAPVLGHQYNLTAISLATAPPDVGTPALGQTHHLEAAPLAGGAPDVTAPALGQVHVLVASNLAAGSPVLGSPAIAGTHVLVASDLVTAPAFVGAPAMTQVHPLVALDLTVQPPVVGAPIFRQAHALVAVNLTVGAPVLGAPVLVQIIGPPGPGRVTTAIPRVRVAGARTVNRVSSALPRNRIA